MDIGATFTPTSYSTWFPALTARPDFTRVFFKPGDGLRPLTDPAIANLPAGCLPWISHKDPVPVATLRSYWDSLATAYPRRQLRWTFHHEAAPDTDPHDFRSYWSDLIHAARDFPGIEPVQIQTNYAMRWRPDTNWRDWIIDGVSLGFDCYPLANFRYEPPESMFGLLQAATLEYGCPSWGVPELGAPTRPGQDRGTWLRDCVTCLQEADADFVGLWGAGPTYAPLDRPTLAAFNAIVGS